MEEKKKSFFSKDGDGIPSLVDIVSIIVAFLFLFGTVLTYEIKYYLPDETKVKEYFNLNLIDLFDGSRFRLWPMILIVSLLGLCLLVILTLVILRLKKVNSKYLEGLVSANILIHIFALLSIMVHKEVFLNFASNDINHIENFNGVSVGYGTALAAFFVVLGIVANVGSSEYRSRRNIRSLSEDGLLIAMAFVLSLIKFPISVTGGSINLQVLPLMIIALRRGPLDGFICGGIVYGLLTCITDGYGFATYPFDYLIGFGSVAVIGFFRGLILGENQKHFNIKGVVFIVIGGALSTTVRFAGGCVSSMAVYGLDLLGALTYNVLYVFISGAISIGVLVVLYEPLIQVNRRFPSGRFRVAAEEKE